MKFERKHDWLDIASFAAIGVAAAAVVAGVVYISKKCRDYIECADLLDDECDCGCECDDDCCCDDECDCGCDCEDDCCCDDECCCEEEIVEEICCCECEAPAVEEVAECDCCCDKE